jgi:hypothetical protein
MEKRSKSASEGRTGPSRSGRGGPADVRLRAFDRSKLDSEGWRSPGRSGKPGSKLDASKLDSELAPEVGWVRAGLQNLGPKLDRTQLGVGSWLLKWAQSSIVPSWTARFRPQAGKAQIGLRKSAPNMGCVMLEPS